MDNIAVYLSQQEWQQVMAMISMAPWRDANPVLMKIGEQVRQQTQTQPQPEAGAGGLRPGNVNGPNKQEVRS